MPAASAASMTAAATGEPSAATWRASRRQQQQLGTEAAGSWRGGCGDGRPMIVRLSGQRGLLISWTLGVLARVSAGGTITHAACIALSRQQTVKALVIVN